MSDPHAPPEEAVWTLARRLCPNARSMPCHGHLAEATTILTTIRKAVIEECAARLESDDDLDPMEAHRAAHSLRALSAPDTGERLNNDLDQDGS